MAKINISIFLLCLFSMVLGTPGSIQSKYTINNIPEPWIVGGEDAPEGFARHMVGLLIGDVISWVNCGGSIISKNHILTAAHCVEPSVVWGELLPSFRAVVGSNSWSKANVTVRFKSYVIHPSWSWNTLKNDISVLTTATDIVFNARVSPIKLALDFEDGTIRSYVTGWGRLGLNGESPDKLQLLRLNKLSSTECYLRMLWAAYQDGGMPPPYSPLLEVCTFHSVRHGLCHGDSGSALVGAAAGRQLGVVSWGHPCARGHPDVYVRVSAYASFLRNIVDGL